MWYFDYSSTSSIKFVLAENNLKMTKKRGQNFLIDNNVRRKITDIVLKDLPSDASLWEIGPGLGSITSILLKSGHNLSAFELDFGFIEILENAFKDERNFSLISGDALITVRDMWDKTKVKPYVILGNLPYNVGTVLIAKMLENEIFPERMVFTLQKEVAERMVSKTGDEDWGSLSALTSLTYERRVAFDISSVSFWPSPNIKSAVVVLEKLKNNSFDYSKYTNFLKVNRAIFSQKRKTIKNNLLLVFDERTEAILKECKINPSIRPNLITLEEIIKLCDFL